MDAQLISKAKKTLKAARHIDVGISGILVFCTTESSLRKNTNLIEATEIIVGATLDVILAGDFSLLASRNKQKFIMNQQPTLLNHHIDIVIHGDAFIALPEIQKYLGDIA
jgi:NAD-dependent SIR2 family protein deacetylase